MTRLFQNNNNEAEVFVSLFVDLLVYRICLLEISSWKNDGEKNDIAKRDPSDRLRLPEALLGELRLPLGKRHSLNPSTHFTASSYGYRHIWLSYYQQVVHFQEICRNWHKTLWQVVPLKMIIKKWSFWSHWAQPSLLGGWSMSSGHSEPSSSTSSSTSSSSCTFSSTNSTSSSTNSIISSSTCGFRLISQFFITTTAPYSDPTQTSFIAKLSQVGWNFNQI